METIGLEGLGLQVGRGSPIVRKSYILGNPQSRAHGDSLSRYQGVGGSDVQRKETQKAAVTTP